jgi:hypothetical protein
MNMHMYLQMRYFLHVYVQVSLQSQANEYT